MDTAEVLPEGFLEKTARTRKVNGRAPLAQVLAHPSTSGFVSHCGWNSTLESIWFGVPMVTWPMYPEQQLSAFLLVKEMELAAKIRIDYRKETWVKAGDIVSADEIKEGIRQLMEEAVEKRRKKMNELS